MRAFTLKTSRRDSGENGKAIFYLFQDLMGGTPQHIGYIRLKNAASLEFLVFFKRKIRTSL